MDKFNNYINDNYAAEKGLELNWVHGSLYVSILSVKP